MIPKTIHYCWFGYGQKSRLMKKCIQSWYRICPDYKIIEWNESNFNINMNEYTRMCYREKKYAFLSDYARLWIVYKYGGIYLDIDVELLKRPDALLSFPAFYGFENEYFIASGLGFGAEAGHRTVKALLKQYDQLLDGKHGTIGCPMLNTKALEEEGFIPNGKCQKVHGALILSSEYLNPYDYPTGRLCLTKRTISIHWFAKSWMGRKIIIRSKIMQPIHRVFGTQIRSKIFLNTISNATEKMDRNVGLEPKKKVLIIMPSMFIGGAERSLLGLLDSFDYSRYEISLFLYRHEGEFLKYIPKKVKILPEIEAYRTFDVPIKSLIFSKKWLFGIVRLLSKLFKTLHCRITKEQPGLWMSLQYISRCLQPLLPKIPGNYDAGIMFLSVPDTLVNKVNAKVKLAWCHTDYDTLCPDYSYDRKIYKKIDYIVHVSEICARKTKEIYPEFRSKIVVVENILSNSLVLNQATEFNPQDMSLEGVDATLLSIGRFCEAKNFDSIPEICQYILDSGIKVRWYIIGYGGDENLIKSKIQQFDMKDYVIILGKKENPYPYLKKADIYVQPSRYEGKCVAVREAQILEKPVVITNFDTSSDQLIDNYDGIITNMDNKDCAEKIIALIRDSGKQEELICNCRAGDYTNKHQIDKLYEFIE